MRRADRLFQIIQTLRRRRVVTAAYLAEELEVSERTIYRDMRDLSLSGVPIQGEAGVGYALPAGFDLPPLMFTEEELEALVLGARMVESWGDPKLATAARQALNKVEVVLPERLRLQGAEPPLFAPARRLATEKPGKNWSCCAVPSRPGASCSSPTTASAASARSARCIPCACSSGARFGPSRRGAPCAGTSVTSG